jgi:uncharacterized protein YbaP (TraB family)
MPRSRRTVCAISLPLILLLPGVGLAQDAPAKKKTVAKPFLWKIEGKTKPSFLYGTIHLPSPKVLRLPKVVEEAMGQSDAVYTELAFDPSLQAKVMQFVTLPGGKKLNDVLSDEVYKRAEKYMAAKGLPLWQMAQFKPWFLVSQLSLLEYRAELMRGLQPLDQMLYTKAKKAKKEVGGLETLKEQVDALDTLEPNRFLGRTLDGLEKAAKTGKRASAELLEAYLTGETKKLLEIQEKELDPDNAEDQKFMKLLVNDRNVRMADRIQEKLKKSPGKSYFFAVGVLHYPGEKGILALLKAKGLKIKRLTLKGEKKKPVGAGSGKSTY